MDTTTLAHVNTPPAQTWNYLRVNDIALDVPTPAAPAEKYDGPLADLEMGAGDAATSWIDATSAERTVISKELPLEYAVEMNNLIKLEMEGAIG